MTDDQANMLINELESLANVLWRKAQFMRTTLRTERTPIPLHVEVTPIEPQHKTTRDAFLDWCNQFADSLRAG